MNTSKLRHSLLLASLIVPFFSTGGCASEDKTKDKPGDVPAGGVDVGFVSAETCAGPQRGSGFAWDCETGTTIAVSRGSCDELHEFCFNLQSRHTNYVCVWNDTIIAGARDGVGAACPSVGASFDDSGYGGAGGASGGSAGAGGGSAGGGTAGGGGDAGSCEGYCGAQSPEGCFCDELCERIGDCCSDKPIFCGAGGAGGAAGGGTSGAGGGYSGAGGASGGSAGAGGGTAGAGGASGGSAGAGGGTAGGGGGDFFGSCEGFCGGVSPDGCFCDEICEQAGDCCTDKVEFCGGGAGGEGGFGGGYSGAGGGAGAGGGTSGGGGFGGGTAGAGGGNGGFGGGTAGAGGGNGGFGGGTAGAGGGNGGFGGGTAGAGGGNGGAGGGAAGAGGNAQGDLLGALLQKLLLSAERSK